MPKIRKILLNNKFITKKEIKQQGNYTQVTRFSQSIY